MKIFDQIDQVNIFEGLNLEYWRHQANGLEVVLSPQVGSHVSALQIWYRVGSAHEKPQMTGLAHFFEHMMFRGTKNHGVGEFDRILEEHGVNGGTNAFTWKDYTAYVEEMPRQNLEKALELEADRMCHLDLTDQTIHEEIGAVLDEKCRSLNECSSVRFDTFFERAFQGEPGAWPVLGYEDHIRAYNPEILENFYRSYYNPSNALVVICGDFEASQALSLVDKHFGSLKPGPKNQNLTRRLQPGFHQMDQAISLNRLELTFALEASEDPWLWDIAGRLLAGGDACVFEKELVSQGKALSVSYWLCEASQGHHFLTLYFSILPQYNFEQIKDQVMNLISSADRWLTPELVSIARVESDCEYYAQMGQFDERASALGEVWIYDAQFSRFGRREQTLESLDSVTLAKKIQSLAAANCFEMRAQSLD